MEQTESFIIHIYQHIDPGKNSQGESEIIGVVEGVESEKKIPFTNSKQLWEILVENQSVELPKTRHN